MVQIAEILVAALIVVGGLFALIGSWAMVRLPSVMERLHGPTMATTLGLGALLIASMLAARLGTGIWSTRELLIALFAFITAPITATMIAKVHLHRQRTMPADEPDGMAGAPPRPGAEAEWATFEAPRTGTPASTVES